MLKQQVINKVKAIILKYSNPERIYLYGSQSNGEFNSGSDIDIAYDDPEFTNNCKIEDEVDRISTLIKIDVTNISNKEDRFKNRVKSTGKVIYSATKKLRSKDGLYNFSNALEKFIKAIQLKTLIEEEGFGDIYLDLIVKRFEFTFEMGWKAIKRYLEYLGFEGKNPRSCIREAFSQGIIDNENVWLDMIDQRNLSSHVYDESQIEELLDKTEEYKDAFVQLKKNITIE